MAKANHRTLHVEERRLQILSIIESKGSVAVSTICEQFDVSEVTARGDLDELERLGKLRRIRGGALSINHTLMVTSPTLRQSVNTQAKRAIAQVANTLINDGESIFMDSGTTTLELVKTLGNKRDLTIVTSDLPIASYIDANLPETNLIFAGGLLRKRHHYACDQLALRTLREFYADKAFLGSNSFTPEQGFMTEFTGAGDVKRVLIENARERYMLIDASKIGLKNFVRFASLEDVDFVIMDKDPDNSVQNAIGKSRRNPMLMMA